VISGRSVVANYLTATGQFLTRQGSETHPECQEHFLALRRAFRKLDEMGAAAKGFVAHVPRPDLPGKCFGIVAAFHDLPDPFLAADQNAYEDFQARLYDRAETPGMLFEVRQVWQTAGGKPRLIEATVEVTSRFREFRLREIPRGFFPDSRVEQVTCDPLRGGHFEFYGGGMRCGFIWCDRSLGIGEAQPWSAAYRVFPNRDVRTDLPGELVTALQEFVTRF
jgi:hypothetical protein